MMNVALLDDYQSVAMKMADWNSLAPRATVTAFSDHLDDVDALAERLHSFDVVVLMRERITASCGADRTAAESQAADHGGDVERFGRHCCRHRARHTGLQELDDLADHPLAENCALGLIVIVLARAIPQEENACDSA